VVGEGWVECARLPGIGTKTAQRLAFSILRGDMARAQALAEAVLEVKRRIRFCARCFSYAEDELCGICSDPRRDDAVLCVVESAADILAFEQAGGYRGRYFVLHGHLSPIDGIGPEALGLDLLERRARELAPQEVILATNPTVEGEATAHYISELLGDAVGNVTRIAHGVPLGGELEYIDGGTLVHALQGRRSIR